MEFCGNVWADHGVPTVTKSSDDGGPPADILAFAHRLADAAAAITLPLFRTPLDISDKGDRLHEVSLEARPGEIVGLGGLDGHVTEGGRNLSAGEARRVLLAQGIPNARIYQVAGRADSEPLFADDPTLPGNRRVAITLLREAPPLPAGHGL